MQLYIDRARLDEQQPGGFDLVKGLVDVGDIVGCAGGVKRTDKGELSVVAASLQVGGGRGHGGGTMHKLREEGGPAQRGAVGMGGLVGCGRHGEWVARCVG